MTSERQFAPVVHAADSDPHAAWLYPGAFADAAFFNVAHLKAIRQTLEPDARRRLHWPNHRWRFLNMPGSTRLKNIAYRLDGRSSVDAVPGLAVVTRSIMGNGSRRIHGPITSLTMVARKFASTRSPQRRPGGDGM